MTIRARPIRRLTFNNFSSFDYPQLNGRWPLSATKLDIERSLLMVGYPSAQVSVATVGAWRAQLLFALVEGYLTPQLATTSYFRALEPSERVSMTFLLAQAFTHWAAENYMAIPILLHVAGASASYTVASRSAAAKGGAGPIRKKSRPDFIGIAPGEYHVFESKGRSLPSGSKSVPATIAAGCSRAALAQVSRIATVNGVAPKTRTASVWVLTQRGAHGYATDPPAVREVLHLSFDLDQALLQYYRIVLDAGISEPDRVGRLFSTFSLSDRRSLIVDRKLFVALRRLADGGAEGKYVLDVLKARRPTYERARRITLTSPSVTLGFDGVGLVAVRGDSDRRSWRDGDN